MLNLVDFAPAYQVSFQMQYARKAIYSNANAEYVRWWRRTPAASFDPQAAQSNPTDVTTGGTGFQAVEQSVSSCMMVISEPSVRRRFSPAGQYLAGDLICMGMSDDFPGIGYHDWIVPVGVLPWTPGVNIPDTRVYREARTVIRGGTLVAQAGTVTAAGTAVTGIGTAFLSAFQVGDIIVPAGQPAANGKRITAVASDTSLTIESSTTTPWRGIPCLKGTDQVPYHPVAYLDDVRDESTVYRQYGVSQDGSGIQWTSATASPVPGARYSVAYRYWPKYEIFPSMGSSSHVVKGISVFKHVLRLYVPEGIRGAGTL